MKSLVNVSGSNADYLSKVEIDKVGGGYFSSYEVSDDFIVKSLRGILGCMPKNINFYDLGGGDGFLGERIREFFEENGFNITTTIVDDNVDYLKKAKERGLNVIKSDISDCQEINRPDLVVMRSVNHYNQFHTQRKVLHNCFRSMADNGFLVSQFISGSRSECIAMNKLMNHPLLGRAGNGHSYYVTTEEEYIELLLDSGFSNIEHLGYAKTTYWGNEMLWQRFNKARTEEFLEKNNLLEKRSIEERHRKYIQLSNEIIENTLSHSNNFRFKKNLGGYEIELKFPIIRCKKNK